MALTGSYITVAEADVYAAAEVEASAWDALTDDQKAAAVIRATDELDAVRFQGRKYDADQGRQFPRVVDEQLRGDGSVETQSVWDFDDDENEAVVPDAVKKATFLQALSIADGSRDPRADDRHDGVSGQSAGGVSESYDTDRPMRILCRRAHLLMKRYALKTGKIV